MWLTASRLVSHLHLSLFSDLQFLSLLTASHFSYNNTHPLSHTHTHPRGKGYNETTTCRTPDLSLFLFSQCIPYYCVLIFSPKGRQVPTVQMQKQIYVHDMSNSHPHFTSNTTFSFWRYDTLWHTLAFSGWCCEAAIAPWLELRQWDHCRLSVSGTVSITLLNTLSCTGVL